MLLSVEWLSDHVDLDGIDPAELGELFTLHVAEVDGVSVPGNGWPGVRAGKVLAVRPHPDADKLRLVRVDTGDGEAEVVCGAPNVAEGQTICFAPEGTTLPDGLVLTRRKIRGVESAGMVLSERELGLSDEHEGILVVDDGIATGTPAAEFLPGGAVIDVDNTAITTRPDLWGHHGAAREFAAILERPLRSLDLGPEFPAEAPQIDVRVECPDLCPRYLGWAIGGIKVGPSPDWMRHRLEQAGQRSINNVVDLTNYIQLECGQPIHAFDRRQIAGGTIVVRRAGKDEPVTTLDGAGRKLPDGACVIADPERAVAIAGVMGLLNSEVRDDTTEIILEVANFEMTSVRATAQALGLRTESSSRFEKGLDPESVPVTARRFLQVLKRLCPDAHPLGGACDVAAPPLPRREIAVEPGFFAERLGIELEPPVAR
ncbi:MAG: phenylalanine--tRNA ligase subunit beta, partial [Planctomycetota bacterium]|nr:phenylalanine--tRNA ligase subunit beta [Planctomycetota bacterium]